MNSNNSNPNDPYEPLTYDDIRRMVTEAEIAEMQATDFGVEHIIEIDEIVLAPRIPDGVDEATKELIEMLTEFCDRFIGLLSEVIDVIGSDHPEFTRSIVDTFTNYFNSIAEA